LFAELFPELETDDTEEDDALAVALAVAFCVCDWLRLFEFDGEKALLLVILGATVVVTVGLNVLLFVSVIFGLTVFWLMLQLYPEPDPHQAKAWTGRRHTASAAAIA